MRSRFAFFFMLFISFISSLGSELLSVKGEMTFYCVVEIQIPKSPNPRGNACCSLGSTFVFLQLCARSRPFGSLFDSWLTHTVVQNKLSTQTRKPNFTLPMIKHSVKTLATGWNQTHCHVSHWNHIRQRRAAQRQLLECSSCLCAVPFTYPNTRGVYFGISTATLYNFTYHLKLLMFKKNCPLNPPPKKNKPIFEYKTLKCYFAGQQPVIW